LNEAVERVERDIIRTPNHAKTTKERNIHHFVKSFVRHSRARIPNDRQRRNVDVIDTKIESEIFPAGCRGKIEFTID